MLNKETRINNCLYIAEIENNDIRYNIIPDNGLSTPTSLYKYHSLSENSMDSLINSYLYATHPMKFNDIFDCHENLIDFDDNNFIRKFLSPVMSDFEIEDRLKNDINELKRSVSFNFKLIQYGDWGIVSLTENINSILMWSYYSNHKGFTIEFDYRQFPFEYYGPFPINYQKELTPLSIKENHICICVLYQATTKSIEWQHEKEWRIFILPPLGEKLKTDGYKNISTFGDHNRKFYYPIQSIKSITFGNRFFDVNELFQIDNNSFKIQLSDCKENNLKKAIISFIIKHEIDLHLVLGNHPDFKIVRVNGLIKKLNKNKYTLTLKSKSK